MDQQQDEGRGDQPKTKKVVYNPGPGDPVSTTWHGQHFVKGVPVEVETASHGAMLDAVDGNAQFGWEGQDLSKEAEERAEREAKLAEENRKAMAAHDRKAMDARHKQEREAMDARHGAEDDALKARDDAAEHGGDDSGSGREDGGDDPGPEGLYPDPMRGGGPSGEEVADPMRDPTRAATESKVNAPTVAQRTAVGTRPAGR